VKRTFGRVDADQNVFITVDELNELTGDPEKTRDVMRNVDYDSDNQISYPEFVKAVRPEADKLAPSSPRKWWRMNSFRQSAKSVLKISPSTGLVGIGCFAVASRSRSCPR